MVLVVLGVVTLAFLGALGGLAAGVVLSRVRQLGLHWTVHAALGLFVLAAIVLSVSGLSAADAGVRLAWAFGWTAAILVLVVTQFWPSSAGEVRD